MKIYRAIVISILFAFAATTVFAQKKVKDTFLTKKTYLVEVTIAGGKKQKVFAEELNFASGKIKVKQLGLEEHFLQGDYEVSKVDSSGEAMSIDFKGSCKNDKEEYIILQGTVFGEMIDGTITWETKKKKVKSEMTFTGNLKVKGQKFVAGEKTIENNSGTQKSSGKGEAKPSGKGETKPGDSKSPDKKSKEDNLDDEILNDDL